jgi:hypothetical protein
MLPSPSGLMIHAVCLCLHEALCSTCEGTTRVSTEKFSAPSEIKILLVRIAVRDFVACLTRCIFEYETKFV